MRLHDLLDAVDLLELTGDSQVEVSDIVHDSRHATRGALFCCIRGRRRPTAMTTPPRQSSAARWRCWSNDRSRSRHPGPGRPRPQPRSARSRPGSSATRPARCGCSASPARTGRPRPPTSWRRSRAAAGERVGIIGTTGARIDGVEEPRRAHHARRHRSSRSCWRGCTGGCRHGRDGGELARARRTSGSTGPASRSRASPTCRRTTSTSTGRSTTTSRRRRACSRRRSPTRRRSRSTTRGAPSSRRAPTRRRPRRARPSGSTRARPCAASALAARRRRLDRRGSSPRPATPRPSGSRSSGSFNVQNALGRGHDRARGGLPARRGPRRASQTPIVVPGRMERVDGRAAVHGARRLRPHARRARTAGRGGPAARRLGPGARGVRVRWRPRPVEARRDGRRGGRRRPVVLDVGQPALGGSRRDRRGRRGRAARRRRDATRSSSTGGARSGIALAAARRDDVVVIAGKGHETGPGRRRCRHPVRRPGRRPRGAGGARVDLTRDEIAAHHRRLGRSAPTAVATRVRVRLAHARGRRRASSRSAPNATATTSSRTRSPAARASRRRAGARRRGRDRWSWSRTRGAALARSARRRATASRARPSSASPGRPARRRPRTSPRPRCARRSRCTPSAASFNNEIGLPVTLLDAPSRHRGGRARDGRALRRATSRSSARSPGRRSASSPTSVSPTPSTSAGPTASRGSRASCSKRSRPTGSRCSAPTADYARRAPGAHAAPGPHRRARRRTPTSGPPTCGSTRSCGPTFRLDSPWGSAADVRLAVRGAYQVANAAQAATVALHLGVPLDAVVAALAAAGTAAWRMELSTSRDGVLVLNDAYNASPSSMRGVARDVRAPPRARAAASPCSGEMRELGAIAAAEHARVGELVADVGVSVPWSPSGRGTDELARPRRRRTASRCTASPDRDAAVTTLRAIVEPGRRRPREGQPARRARARRRGAAPDEGGRPVIAVLIAVSVAFIVSVFGTPFLIRILRARNIGQQIRDDGPIAHPHEHKAGTPTMGGIAIIVAGLLGYLAVAHPHRGDQVRGHRDRALVPHPRTGVRRLARRLPRRPPRPEPRAAQAGQDRRDPHRDRSASRSSRSTSCNVSTHLVVHPAARPRPRHHRLVHLGDRRRLRDVERGQHHRRSRRARRGIGRAGLRRVRRHRVHPVPPPGGLRRCWPPARSTSRWSPPRSWARASGSCGGTRHRPRSSWAIPARSRSAARWPAWACSRRRTCCCRSSAASTSSRSRSVMAQVISFRGFGRRILRMSPIHHHFEILGLARVDDPRAVLDPRRPGDGARPRLLLRRLHPDPGRHRVSAGERASWWSGCAATGDAVVRAAVARAATR